MQLPRFRDPCGHPAIMSLVKDLLKLSLVCILTPGHRYILYKKNTHTTMKPRFTDLTAEFVYTINCPVDAFFDIYDAVNEEIDNCLEAGWLDIAINETCVEIYNHIESTLPVDWTKIIISNTDGHALMDYLDIFEEFLADWYDVNQKKTNPEHASDSR